MKIKIKLHCPDCQGLKIKRNGNKSYGKQNYLCKKNVDESLSASMLWVTKAVIHS
jgi:ribosomal protein L33